VELDNFELVATRDEHQARLFRVAWPNKAHTWPGLIKPMGTGQAGTCWPTLCLILPRRVCGNQFCHHPCE